jgi:hypothetical protein
MRAGYSTDFTLVVASRPNHVSSPDTVRSCGFQSRSGQSGHYPNFRVLSELLLRHPNPRFRLKRFDERIGDFSSRKSIPGQAIFCSLLNQLDATVEGAAVFGVIGSDGRIWAGSEGLELSCGHTIFRGQRQRDGRRAAFRSCAAGAP